jgi:hypothetical protein
MDDTSHTNYSSSLLADLSFCELVVLDSEMLVTTCKTNAWLVRHRNSKFGGTLLSINSLTESSFETIVIEITGTYTRVSNVEMHPSGIIESSKLHGDSRLSRIYDTNACHLSTVRHELLQPVTTQWDTIPCKPTVGTNSTINYNRLHAFESNYSNFLIII